LSAEAVCVQIPALEDRGVTVMFGNKCRGEVVVFPGANLEAAVRAAIGKPVG
jgi:hypothetical protein